MKQVMIAEKEWTGERLETFVFSENTIEHLHRYAITFKHIKNKVVLDIASGEGYGSNLMSKSAKRVIGVDIDQLAVNAAIEKYGKDNLVFKQGQADAIPIDNCSIDVVVSFETIEHHTQHQEMMSEIKRVLKPGGLLLISSPDKKFYSDQTGHKNFFHKKELYFDEFKDLILRNFKHAKFLSQGMFRGSIIVPESGINGFESFKGDYDDVLTNIGFTPVYNLAIASEKEIDELDFSVFNSDDLDVFNMQCDIENARKLADGSVRNTWSYKIGNVLVRPFSILKKIFTHFN